MRVKIYTLPTCVPCATLKHYLKTRNVAYEELKLDERPELVDQLIRTSGTMIVPTTVIGSEVIVGMNLGRIKSALNITT